MNTMSMNRLTKIMNKKKGGLANADTDDEGGMSGWGNADNG